ncbi:hypothetical protein UFOVP257_119 [uncultured Caudovirales phage]|uniref:Major tropism determinant N-terminal domain-containing protein n=1 Tax=uncultured Caudovirales phage TaxID=2100421 RepID=A0A6J5LI95_9CAUD|nr:hypothetical protein UFOVP257_119 [uncultured Caudovirales phage]
MANRIQLRRDTTSNWENINPVLADGEPGYDIVTNEIRIGDGSTAWSGLSGNVISGGGGGTVSTLTNGSFTASLNSSGEIVTATSPSTGVAINAASVNSVDLPTNGQYDFTSFSGEILANDLDSGYVYKFLVGSGNVFMLGCTNGNWTATFSAPISSYELTGWIRIEYTGSAYRFTNLAARRNYNFVAIKTRNNL